MKQFCMFLVVTIMLTKAVYEAVSFLRDGQPDMAIANTVICVGLLMLMFVGGCFEL